jgi:hypothetical protein
MSLMLLVVGSVEKNESEKADPGIIAKQASHSKYNLTNHHPTDLITTFES